MMLMLGVFNAQAQETMYGVRGGIGLSSLNFDQSVDFDNDDRIGGFFGAFVDFGISEKFSVMTEVNFSAEGSKNEPYEIDFIQVPVQLRYALSNDVKIGVGPQVSFTTWDRQDVLEQYALSVVGGIELMVSDMIFVDFRYNYGFTDITQIPVDNEATNSSFQLGFGIKL